MANDNVVMISSTVRDLPSHREEVLAACLAQSFLPRMMEHLPASDADAIAASLGMVDEAAAYIGIFGHRYGFVPAGHAISITEMEYNRAAERGIPRLVFFIHDDHPMRASDVETGAGAEKLQAFKERLGKERVAGFFKSPEDLRGRVISSLAALRERTSPAQTLNPTGATKNLSWRPHYRDALMRDVAERSEELRQRRRELLLRGADPTEVTALETELLDLKRRLREGPRLAAGDCLSNRYFLVEELGSGGFATVWKAFDEENARLVAVKVLHGQFSDNMERRDRFRRGAKAMHGLVHAHITRVLEPYREDGGHHYFVMEFVVGGTFLQAVLDGKVPSRQVGRIILQVGDGLGFAHAKSVIHRDVSPDNILLDERGLAKLTDFDLVRVPDSTGGTRTGALGKFVYAAPESLESAEHVDQRCDIYSLGMTATFGYHGKRVPASAFTRQSAFLRQLQLPGRLKAVLARAIRHDPASRYESMMEFCDALRGVFKKRLLAAASAQSQGPVPRPLPKRSALAIAVSERDLLISLSNSLAKTRDLDADLSRIGDILLNLFPQADRCFLVLADGDRLVPRIFKTRRAGDGGAAFSRAAVRKSLDQSQAFLVDDTNDDFAGGATSVMCAPLACAEGPAFGVLQLDTSSQAQKFLQKDLDLLSGVANQVAMYLDYTRLLHEAQVQAKMNRDLQLGHQVQMSFLPATPPKVVGYEFANYYKAAHELGGDFFDYIPLAEGRVAVVIADVAGKGIPASLIMAKLSSQVRYALATEPDPAKALGRLNELVTSEIGTLDRFITLAMAVLDPRSHIWTMINAGHIAPMHYRAKSGDIINALPQNLRSFPLGIMAEFTFESYQMTLEPGDRLLLTTDGLEDAIDSSGQIFGTTGIQRALEGVGDIAPQHFIERLVAAIERHLNGQNMHDDFTAVVVGRNS